MNAILTLIALAIIIGAVWYACSDALDTEDAPDTGDEPFREDPSDYLTNEERIEADREDYYHDNKGEGR